MPKYQLTGRLTLKDATTNTIRATIEASSPAEAQEKFKDFLRRKAEPVVDSCQVPDPFEEAGKIISDFFSNLKSEGK